MTYSLSARSLWIDEALSVTYARQSLGRLFPFFVHGEMNMALYHFLLHFWLRLGDSERVIRSLSVLFALATIPFAYAIGARLFSRRAGALAAIALALNGVFYSYSREARSYSFVMLLVVAGTYALLRALEDGRVAWWCAYVALMALAVYAHFFALFVAGAHFLSVLLARPDRARAVGITLSSTAIVLLAVPVLVYIGSANPDKVTLKTTHLSDVVKLFRWYAVNNRPLLAVYVVGAVAAVAGTLWSIRRRGSREAWPLLLLITWLAVPIVGALIISYAVHPMFAYRYLLVGFPALVLLVAGGLASVPSSAVLVVAALVLTGASVRSLTLCQPGCGTAVQDFRGATAFVVEHASSGDRVVFDPPYLDVAYRYYARGAGPAAGGKGSGSGRATRMWLLVDLGDPNTQNYKSLVSPLDREKRLLAQRFGQLEVALYRPSRG
jgi:mannosyltransferase